MLVNQLCLIGWLVKGNLLYLQKKGLQEIGIYEKIEWLNKKYNLIDTGGYIPRLKM